MKIYKVSYTHNMPNDAKYPCIALVKNKWDDFGFRTTFSIRFYEVKNKFIDLEYIKILDRNTEDTIIKNNLDELDDNFCSLGQSTNYYKKLADLPDATTKDILISLNDVVFNRKIHDEFSLLPGFHSSLLRESLAYKALIEGPAILENMVEEKKFSFKFRYAINGSTGPFSIDFNFKENEPLPYRTNVIIGKNGTGKTEILGMLGRVLSSGNKDFYSKHTDYEKPLFEKILAVSYSYFDDFEKPPLDDMKISYVYCGLIGNIDIQNHVYDTLEEEVKSLRFSKGNNLKRKLNELEILVKRQREHLNTSHQLKNKLKDSIKIIKKDQKLIESWKEILSSIFSEYDNSILNAILINPDSIKDFKISSGQNIILSIFSEVIANIGHESILLIDEPEIHLHPNAIANFMKMLNTLLEKFNSYAIISTHSPIIVQETPKEYVRVIEREYFTTAVRSLSRESFGEDLTEIIQEIFNVRSSESNYQSVFGRMVKEGLTFEEIESRFNMQLSIHAKGILLSQIPTKGE